MQTSYGTCTTLLGYSSPLLTHIQTSILDRLEQCHRYAQRLVRPFRYWNFLRVIKISHHSLALYGLVLLWVSNRCISHHGGHGQQEAVTAGCFLRRSPLTWNQAGHQLTWLVYTALMGGFPFYAVRHPPADSWFRNWAHPMLYWFFLCVYKCIWSTWHVVGIAHFVTDPRSNPPPSQSYRAIYQRFQRERIVEFQNLRYQHQWSSILQELHSSENQAHVKAVRINNRWVALGGFGAAVQDVVDDTLDRHLMRPVRICMFFQRLGQAFPYLQEISISMTLNLPLNAIAHLLEYALLLHYLRLDGVALSVHDLQPDLLEFGRSLHGLGGHRELGLKTLLLEDCRLENDEPDPQIRTRYSMDLLLAPAVYTALTPPTRLCLQHLRLWVHCQRISVLELAVVLGSNRSLLTLDLHLVRDNSNNVDVDEGVEDQVEWVLLPLAQVLQQGNRTLQNLEIQLQTEIPAGSVSERAVVRMMECNETLLNMKLIRADTQARIRIPQAEFYLKCNRLGRRQFRLDSQQHVLGEEWVEVLIGQKRHTAVIYLFLQIMDPALLLGLANNNWAHLAKTAAAQRRQKKLLKKAWKVLQRHVHWANLACDTKR